MLQNVSIEGVDFRVCANGARRRYWERVNAGDWEPHTFKVFRRFLDPTRSAVDIGAWIGPTALYAAQRARRVLAIEPDATAHAELEANVAANPGILGRISLHRQCIAPQSGPVELFAGGMYHSDSSAFGDSMSGMVGVGRPGQPRRQVEGVELVEFLEREGIIDCGFIKMDVEGGEYSLIPRRWRQLADFGMPTSCVSFHAPAPALRGEQIGDCVEELSRCYRWLYAASDPAIADVAARVAAVRDWADEAPGSPWRALERLLGDGLVASNEAW